MNMALESSTVPGPGSTAAKPLAVGSEFKNALLALRGKYEKHKAQLEEACVEEGHEMYAG